MGEGERVVANANREIQKKSLAFGCDVLWWW